MLYRTIITRMSRLSAALGLMSVLFFTISIPVSAQTNNTIIVTDDTGQELHFEHAPQRIVSLSPGITENLFAIGLGERVVGVSS